ncbi:soma ferritin [Trichogramma pretiosum]|uniref:soma ferritin n=1 Tax=Trichogramma pretiosum TaxID=7493 RepID=UPI0006C98DDF|nr:soma ferritin [Trichogramma pretiosum]
MAMVSRFSKIKFSCSGLVFCLLWIHFIRSTASEYCYSNIDSACHAKSYTISESSDSLDLEDCNAKYGSIDEIQDDFLAYADDQLQTSFEYLLLSAQFNNYDTNRAGFHKLYRKLSDVAWENALAIIRYINSRGGQLSFENISNNGKNKERSLNFDMSELHSLARVLDSESRLANEALRLHTLATDHEDGAAAHFLEEELIRKQSEMIRDLAGYTSDLKKLLRQRDAPLGVYLFDDYLRTSL